MAIALEEGDFDRLADLAHWLKGSGPNVGFAEFGGPARELEEACRARDKDAASTMTWSVDFRRLPCSFVFLTETVSDDVADHRQNQRHDE